MVIQIKKRQFATLLEVLIAMALTAIVLTSLTFFYREIDYMNKKSDRLQAESFQRRFLQYRLTQIIPKAIPFGKRRSKGTAFFYSTTFSEGLFKPGTESLVFGYDNCENLETKFASEVLGRLYVDNQSRLCLGIWPAPKRWKKDVPPPMKKEFLFENVDHLKFDFFIPPDHGKLKFLGTSTTQPKNAEQAAQPSPIGDWTQVWLKEYAQLPGIVRITIQPKEEKPLVYEFPLPNCENPIIYLQ